MIAVVYGTTGELIKLAPVLIRLRAQGAAPLTLCSGQQVEQIPRMLDDFGLAQPDLWLGRGHGGRDLDRARDIPGWFAQVSSTFLRHRASISRQLRFDEARPLVMVHGDTFTTVLGAAMARALSIPAAHVEAGIRTGDWRNPFPEELDRRLAARIARIHFAPGPHAAQNLRQARVHGDIVDTGGNTIKDTLALVPAAPPAIDLPPEPFGLVSLHRFELLRRPDDLRTVLELLREASERQPLLFIDHPVTAAAIAQLGLEPLFGARFIRVPRQRYFHFISLLKASAFLITDSGGSQEECAQLGHPCLVHRAATERPDGLGGPVVLSRMDLQTVREFLQDPLAWQRPPATSQASPSDVITAYLARHGYAPVADQPAAAPV